jgi:hypothetical protein
MVEGTQQHKQHQQVRATEQEERHCYPVAQRRRLGVVRDVVYFAAALHRVCVHLMPLAGLSVGSMVSPKCTVLGYWLSLC